MMSADSSGRHDVYLAQPVATREQLHRRVALIGIGFLIVLSTSPVLGHHLLPSTDRILPGRDHVMGVCLIAVHLLLAPVHESFHVLLGLGMLFALALRVRASVRLHRTLAWLGTVDARVDSTNSADFAIRRAAVRAGVPLASLRTVRGLPNPAFTVGWFRPRIYVAAELGDALDESELAAVLAHESAHAAKRDPARASLLRFLGDTLFYIPALRRLADDIADEAEIAADDHAVSRAGIEPAAVASAIVRLAAWKTDRFDGAAVGFANDALLDRRVRRLLGDDTPVRSHVTRRSIGSALVVLSLVWGSGLIMAHPLSAAPAGSMRAHCQHHHEFPAEHLFCLWHFHRGGTTARCPHAGMS